MAENDKKATSDQYDIFVVNDVFPEADKVFLIHTKSLQEIKDTAFIVLDTNALLVPYSIGRDSLEQIRKTYHLLASHKRLVIPAQVAREFANNRTGKIAELFQQLNRKKSRISQLHSGAYPLLESLDDYQETVRLEKEIDSQLEKYKGAIDKILNHIRDWRWNDPVSLLYSQLFGKDSIYELKTSKEDIRRDLQFRQTHKIPPGYKDAGKDDNGIGDLLIWHTILQIGKEHKVSVIFVSGDKKPDWWHKSEGQSLYPRYELVDEFRRISGGESFHITSFSEFLNLFGASESIVNEVRKEEAHLVIIDKETAYFEKIVENWSTIVRLVGNEHRNLGSLINSAKPLAIYESTLVVGFDFPILVQKFNQTSGSTDVLANAVSSVLNVRGMRVKVVVTGQWVPKSPR